MSHIFSVSEITDAVKRTLEGSFPFVWVKGQITNLSRPSSGHLYFSLRDANAVLSCVWFKGSQRGEENFDPLTGEVFEDGPRPGLAKTLSDGQELMVAGRMNVYPPRGNYQLIVEVAQEAGLGALFLKFEQLKQELAAKGYFATERKRALPEHPKRVAVVTAPSGAAIKDFLRIAGERGLGAEIRVYAAPVQGDEAPPKIVEAIEHVHQEGWADTLVLIRGGGSIEDLWAFNDERVAKAVFTSSLPVLAGIGHEVDHTITDMTADVRAATPTHAAQLLFSDRMVLLQQLDELELRLMRSWDQCIQTKSAQLEGLTRGLGWLSPERRLSRWQERFHELTLRLQRAWAGHALHLDDVVNRYSERVETAFGPEHLSTKSRQLENLFDRLHWAGDKQIMAHERAVERATLQLEGANPELPLERGYSLVQMSDGRFLRSVDEVAESDRLDVVLKDGKVGVSVLSTTRNE